MSSNGLQVFASRTDAGQQLAQMLTRYRSQNPIVLALPRGGVVVGYEIARTLCAPLDVLIVRKLGVPIQPELAFGAIAEGGEKVIDPRTVSYVGLRPEEIEQVVATETEEIARRLLRYRQGRPLPDLTGRTVILVDDGLATGLTAQAAVRALRARKPAQIVLAVPVASRESAQMLLKEVDNFVSLENPASFWAVGYWYEDFSPVSDNEVLTLLERLREPQIGFTQESG
jgi:predicted phosphoribosyltransferase